MLELLVEIATIELILLIDILAYHLKRRKSNLSFDTKIFKFASNWCNNYIEIELVIYEESTDYLNDTEDKQKEEKTDSCGFHACCFCLFRYFF